MPIDKDECLVIPVVPHFTLTGVEEAVGMVEALLGHQQPDAGHLIRQASAQEGRADK